MIAPNPSNDDDDLPQGFDPSCTNDECSCHNDADKEAAWDEATTLANTLSNYTICALMHMVKSRIVVTDLDGEPVPYRIEGFRPYTGDIMLTMIPDSCGKED